jgi:glutamine phosphoribosylpyrophosphate amidotransferase
MCEMLAIAAPEPIAFEQVLPWAMQLDRLGIAGFGWGVTWLDGNRVRRYRNVAGISDDTEGRNRLAAVESSRFLVHLRRPSRLSTIDLADTQPFLQEEGAFAFCHNGEFERHSELRPLFAGLLAGKADSEVGFRLFESLLLQGQEAGAALAEVHATLGGRANLGFLGQRGELLLYAGHPGNLLWTFTLGALEIGATALHSADLSVFDLIFPAATERRTIGSEVVLLGGPVTDPIPLPDRRSASTVS